MFKSNRPINPDKDFFGFKMRTRVRYFDEKILNEEMDPTKNMYRIPDNPKVVVDIGAHIGGTAIRAASMGATVLAFEPEEFNFEVLCHNVEVNGLSDKIVCRKLGVGKLGKQKIYVHPRASGTTSSYLTQKGLTQDKYQVVQFISIKDLIIYTATIPCFDLLKLDCEGSEADIIRDFDDDMAARVNQISVEFHDKKIMGELIEILSKWYTPQHLKRYEWTFYKK